MIHLKHIKLDTIARKHAKELKPWVEKRFNGMLTFFDTLESKRPLVHFPKKALLNSTSDISKVQLELWTKVLAPHFKNTALLNDIKTVMDNLRSELDNLLKGNLNELDRIVQLLEPTLAKHRQKVDGKWRYVGGFNAISKAMIHVFDYKKFTVKMGEGKWDAYTLSEKLGVKVCPYCNRLYTNTVIKPKKKGRSMSHRKIIRAELDHFYVKAYYPFLRLAFYNLVPSCHTCNSSLKGEETMDIRNHIHPYREGFHDTLEFKTGITVDDYLKNLKKKKTIKLIPTKGVSYSKVYRANKNKDLFELEVIYNEHKDIAYEIFDRTINNPKEHIKKIADIKSEKGNSIFEKDHQLYKHLIGNFMLEQDFYKRPLSKFQHDIAKETGLIERINEVITD